MALLVLHWIGDFALQTNWMAARKSCSLLALLVHVLTYTVVLAIGAYVLLGTGPAVHVFIAVNFIFHLATDLVTSRISSRYYAAGNMRGFFVTIGLDQMLHHIALILTLEIIVRSDTGLGLLPALFASA